MGNTVLFAQSNNYVVNSGFEEYTTCPINSHWHNIVLAPGWDMPVTPMSIYNSVGYIQAAPTRFSVEYFNQKCNTSQSTDWRTILRNTYGTESPHSGTGYGGISIVDTPAFFVDNNFLQGTLKPLQTGQEYYFEMWLSLADYSKVISGNIGVLFSDTPITPIIFASNYNGSKPLNKLIPDIIDSSFITNLNGWYKISGNYKAKGTEKYFFIGMFNSKTYVFTNASSPLNRPMSFYYIDDVKLLLCDTVVRKDFLGPDSLICNKTPFKLDAYQPDSMVSYLWHNNSTNPTYYATQTGTYWVDVSINGCPPFRDSIELQMENTPLVNLGPDTIICISKGIQLHTNPLVHDTGYRYLWNTGDTTSYLFVENTGTFNLQISNHGCSNSDTVNIYRFPLKEFDLGPDTARCIQNLWQLDATTQGAEHYVWSTGDTTATITVNASGLYWADVSNGICHYRDTVRLILNAIPQVDIGPPENTICDNINYTLDAQNLGYRYLWNTGDTTRLLKVTNIGHYKVSVNNNNCIATDSMFVYVLPSAIIDLPPDTLLCGSNTLLLDVTTPNAIYLWQDNSKKPTFAITQQGKYKVSVTLLNSCVSSDSIQVNYATQPTVNLGPDKALCFDAPYTIDVSNSGGDTYLWHNNSTEPVFTATQSGLYWVKVSHQICSATDSIVLTSLPKAIPILGIDTILCSGSGISLHPGNFAVYLWNDNSTKSTLYITQPGTYSVKVTNIDGCTGSDSISYTLHQIPIITLGMDTQICQPDLQLVMPVGYANYLWQDGSIGTTMHVTDYGTYKVTITDEKGCVNQGQITISNGCPTELFVPNAFTPNDDGNNDIFLPVTLNVKSIHFLVYDRWGKLLFESKELGKGWNGKDKHKNEYVISDVYVYTIHYTDIYDKPGELQGNVTLLR